MARLFADATNPSYNSVDAKFDDGSFNLGMRPYDYLTETAFMQKADLSVAGMVQDCAECHVGGGAMEYVPAPVLDDRVSLRDIDSADVNGHGSITTLMFTAFNKFIDTYDVDEDGDLLEVMDMDWDETGVMEMDCLLCHMNGYDYIARRDMLRDAKFDASRAIGAGVAAPNDVAWDAASSLPPAGYGDMVYYNNLVDSDGTNLKFNNFIIANMKAAPPSQNCAFCHFDQDIDGDETTGIEGSDNHGAVDWKKRGDNWRNDVNYDVHTVLGCMGCHERKITASVGTSGAANNALGQCDPGKGIAPFSSVWNKLDGSVKTCEFCHLQGGLERIGVDVVDNATGLPTTGLPESPGDGIIDVDANGYDIYETFDSGDFGAPDPTAKHQALGLTAVIASKNNDGNVDASHMDIIDCAACHVGKISDAGWNTGGAIVDGTGKDAFGRLADHENHYVARLMSLDLLDAVGDPGTDGVSDTPNIGFSWLKGKVIATSVLNTVYWRDKNDVNRDVNGDVQGGGMDTPLMTHLLAVNEAHGWTSLTEDNHGTVTAAFVDARIAALESELDGQLGYSGANPLHIRLSTMAVPFKVNHNIAPTSVWALGKNGCIDCHGAANGMFNGTYEMQGEHMDLAFTAGTATPLTKVNSFTEVTDFHGNLKNKAATRSIAIRHMSAPTSTTMADVTRDQMLWENTFKARNTAWVTSVVGGAITFPGASSTTGNTKGWWLKIETTADGGTTVVTRTKKVSALCTNVTELLTNLGATFNSTFEFDVTDNGAGGIRIVAKPTFQIRINPATSAGPSAFNLGDAVWTATPITSVGGTTYGDRASWVGYLNTITDSAYGVNQPAVAQINGLPAQVQMGDTVTLTAQTDSANERYIWNVQDQPGSVEGETYDYIFDYPGTWQVLLTVVNHNGDLEQAVGTIQVLRDIADTTFTDDGDGDGILYGTAGNATFGINLGTIPTHDELYFFYGDGTRLSEVHSAATYSDSKDYRLKSTFLKLYDPDTGTAHDPLNDPTPGNEYNAYVYQLSVQVKNVGAIVEIVNIQIVIPQL